MQTDSKPFYKRWRFYLVAMALFALSVFMLLLLSVLSLRWINPPVTSFTLQENWQEIGAERYNLREWWVSADEIPDHLKWAVVASEDQLFWEHSGFDMESIRDAWEERNSGVRSRGASTISQQVAKNLYLWPAHSFIRKVLEAGITVLIELFWPKERIIEMYLNIAEFGPGIYGIGKASGHFFDIHATSLNPEMSARLAAVLPSPKRMRVNPPSPFAAERSQWILRQMTQLTGITYFEPIPEEDTPDEDIDPLLFEAEFFLDETLFDKPATPDTVHTDRELQELDLPDSLLFKLENDTTKIID